ncbi:hypothetical protein Bca4012_029741 [Brassica carinata]
MAQSNWEADKMLDVYIYDYLVKKKLHNTAKSFMTEGKVSPDPVAIDAPGGFLFEWWSVFWDIFIARTNEKHSEAAAAYIEAQQGKAREQQLQVQQMQMMRQAQMQRRDPSLGGPMNAIGSEAMIGQSNASAIAAKMYEERMKQPNQMNTDTSQPHMDARMALLKSGTNHHGQMVPGNHQGGVSAALQQLQSRSQQTPEIKTEVNIGASPRQLPVDPSTVYGQGILQSKPGMGNAGLNPGVGALPLKGWPLTGIETIRPGLGPQVQKAFLQNQSQFQLSPQQQQQQQQILAQVQGQGNLNNSSMYGGDMDPRRFTVLPRGTKDGQQNANDGSIGSPMQSSSSKHINMPPVQQSSSQQQDPLLSQQSQQNNRKRKGPSSSGPANSTGTGNTVGPSNSQPSTPSTHTPIDGSGITGNMQHMNNMPKGPMMYGSDGIGGLASSANQLDDMEPFGDVGALEDNVESFLSQDDGDGGSLFNPTTLKRNPSEHAEPSKAFSFSEVSSIRRSSNKVICCNFSSDGKLLASAGHDKKLYIWNMETLITESAPEEHGHIITDVRFRPNSTQLATSSFDKTIKIWDASEPGYFVRTISGHTAPGASTQGHSANVNSVCWNPSGELIASVSEDSVKLWSLNSGDCIHELSSSGNKFHSCVFHPTFPNLLVIGGYQSLELWNTKENKCMTIPAHECVISALAHSPLTGMMASASHDKSVKIWK